MGGKIGAILLTVVIIGFGLYVYNSGILGKGAQGLSALFPHNSSSSTSTFISAPIGPVLPSAPPPLPPPPPRTVSPAEIPPGFTASQLSPYFHEIRFVGAYSGKNTGSYGQISLSTAFGQNETIDVTGWQIKGLRGGEFIPQAINFYDASGLAAPTDIRLKAGDSLLIYSSSAPFNLRLNKCIGYVQHVANFSPPLPATCPQVNQSEIQAFTGACQNYIYSLAGCAQPNLSSPYVPQNDYACRDYLSSHFNYRSCLDEHQSDPDFLSSQVLVWTGNDPLDQFHDKVELLDTNGLLVDIYSY